MRQQLGARCGRGELRVRRVPAGARRISVWILRLVGQARRQYLSRLRPGYVERARTERQGDCRRCGACCNLTFHCPFYNAATGCRIYEKRTARAAIFRSMPPTSG